MNNNLVIYILSDSLGETAQYVARASASQFPNRSVQYKQIPYIPDEAYLDEVIKKIDVNESVLMFTLVVDDIKAKVISACKEIKLTYVDILSEAIESISNLTETAPLKKTRCN